MRLSIPFASRIKRRLQKREARRKLSALNDRALQDIGIERSEIRDLVETGRRDMPHCGCRF
jgi:uncharacterized protein YjiS (DUF1127 family)